MSKYEILSGIVVGVFLGLMILVAIASEPSEEETVLINIGDVVVVFDNPGALQQFKARLVAYPDLAEDLYWLCNLVDRETYFNMSEEQFNDFLFGVMKGAEKRHYRGEKR